MDLFLRFFPSTLHFKARIRFPQDVESCRCLAAELTLVMLWIEDEEKPSVLSFLIAQNEEERCKAAHIGCKFEIIF